MNVLNKKKWFDCVCGSVEHALRIQLYHDGDDREFSISVYLSPYRNIFQRCWAAIKYVIGLRSGAEDWGCFILQDDDVQEFKTLLDEYQDPDHGKRFGG
jgi:hypothetical protein